MMISHSQFGLIYTSCGTAAAAAAVIQVYTAVDIFLGPLMKITCSCSLRQFGVVEEPSPLIVSCCRDQTCTGSSY